MRKSKYLSVVAGFAITASFNAAQAVPLYYTFEGTAENSNQMSGISDIYNEVMGVSLGDTVSYVFLVDDEVSSETPPNGSIINYGHTVTETDSAYSSRFSYYTELVSGTGLVIDENAPRYNDYGVPSAGFRGVFNYSTDENSPYYDLPANPGLDVTGRASNGSMAIWSYPYLPRSMAGSYEDFVQWAVDAPFSANHNRLTVRDDEGNSHHFFHNLRLTSVSETAPQASSVPEPSTFLLMGGVLMGFGAARGRKLYKKT